MDQQQEFKGMVEILDVAEVSAGTPESVLVVLVAQNLEFVVCLEKRPENPDDAHKELRPPVFFTDETVARNYYNFLILMISTNHWAD